MVFWRYDQMVLQNGSVEPASQGGLLEANSTGSENTVVYLGSACEIAALSKQVVDTPNNIQCRLKNFIV
jgi:hypothetical protein